MTNSNTTTNDAPAPSPSRSGVREALEMTAQRLTFEIVASSVRFLNEGDEKEHEDYVRANWKPEIEAGTRRIVEVLASIASDASPRGEAFQQRVQPWMLACFGEEISRDVVERNHRFLEEALELVQSTGCTASEAHQLVDYVFGREIGETHQEIGGVMVTLAALCLAVGEDMHAAGETELARIWTKVEKIRAKQAAKPKHSPLPQHVESPGSNLADAHSKSPSRPAKENEGHG